MLAVPYHALAFQVLRNRFKKNLLHNLHRCYGETSNPLVLLFFKMGTTFVLFQSSKTSPDCHNISKMINSSLVTSAGFLHNHRWISTKIYRNHYKSFLRCFLKYVLYLTKFQIKPIRCTGSIWPGVQQPTFPDAIRVFKILFIKLTYRLTFDRPKAFEKPLWSKERDSSSSKHDPFHFDKCHLLSNELAKAKAIPVKLVKLALKVFSVTT